MSGNGGGTVGARLAQNICGFDRGRITKHALSQARTCILDTVGVTLAGIPERCTQILLETPGIADAPGPSLIFGTDRRTSALDATLVNGTAAHALDFDDFSGVLGGHQSVPLVPLLFALGEERGASGDELMTAYVVGVETEIRIARAVNFHHYDKGWHPTTTLGIFGAVAAAAPLMRLDETRTATALAIAASLAAGIKANFGTMTKPLHVGQCGRNGLLATLARRARLRREPCRLRAPPGLPRSLQRARHLQHRGYGRRLGRAARDRRPLDRAEAIPVLRQHPPGDHDGPRSRQGPAGRSGRDRGDRDPAARPTLAAYRYPESDDAARGEVQRPICRRACLERWRGAPEAFRAACRDGACDPKAPRDHASAARIPRWRTMHRSSGEPKSSSRSRTAGACRPGWITLSGAAATIPMSSDELWEKFSDCVERVLPREQVMPLFERLETLEKASSIRDVMRLLEVLTRHAPHAATAPVRFAKASEQEAVETTWVP